MNSRLSSIAMLSVHTCPVAALGGKKTGGMNVYIRDLARELGNRGISVDIFTRCQSKDSTEIKRLGKNVRVIHIPSGQKKALSPINIYPHLNTFTNGVLAHQKKTKKTYQLIHSHYWLSGLVALKLRQHWHIPILQTFHTLGLVKNIFLPIHQPKQRSTLDGPIYREKPILIGAEIRDQAEKKLVKGVDHILGYTPDEKDHLQTLYQADNNKITLIPPGVDTNRFKPIPERVAKQKIGIDPNQQLLLFVGRLDPIKGIETLLKAISLIKNRHFCVSVIGGENQDQYFKRIKHSTKRLKINDVTTLLGSQDQKILPYYYSAAEMTIIPSSHESFGLVALESMACGTPVVASNVGGLQYLIKDKKTGFLVPPHDPKSLAHCIQNLLKNTSLRQKVGFAAHTATQSYSWAKITPKILKLYEKITSY